MKFARLALAVATIAALAACTPSPKIAATVGDTVITADQVERVIAGCEQAAKIELPAAKVINNLVVLDIFTKIVEEHTGSTDAISDEAIKEILGSSPDAAVAWQDEDCAVYVKAIGAQMIAVQLVPPDILQAGIEGAKVQVNPRYGTWDTTVGVAGTGSLSTTP